MIAREWLGAGAGEGFLVEAGRSLEANWEAGVGVEYGAGAGAEELGFTTLFAARRNFKLDNIAAGPYK